MKKILRSAIDMKTDLQSFKHVKIKEKKFR